VIKTIYLTGIYLWVLKYKRQYKCQYLLMGYWLLNDLKWLFVSFKGGLLKY
jgi:hypothetical protein